MEDRSLMDMPLSKQQEAMDGYMVGMWGKGCTPKSVRLSLTLITFNSYVGIKRGRLL